MATDVMRQQNLESALLFMQTEHANTLKGLHGEIQHLQKRCSEPQTDIPKPQTDIPNQKPFREELTFQLAMETTSTSQEDFYREKCERLEKELRERDRRCVERDEEIEKNGERIKKLETQMKAREMAYKNGIRAKDSEVKHLRGELEQKARTIADMVNQMHSMRKRMVEGSVRLAEEEVPVRPEPPKESAANAGFTRRRNSRRGSIEINPILQSAVIPKSTTGRRLSYKPETPPEEVVPNPEPFLRIKAAHGGQPVKQVSRTPLPPIARSEDLVTRGNTPLRRPYQRDNSPQSSSPEIETLAVDQVGRQHRLRPAQDYSRSNCD